MNASRMRRIRGFGVPAFLLAALFGAMLLGALAPGADAKTGQGFLGISSQELDDDLRDSYGYRGPGGVLVQSVESNSAAGRAGIRRGDVLVRYAGTTVSTPSELGRLVRADEPGKTVPVSVWRDGREVPLQVTLGELDRDVDVRVYGSDDDDDDGEYHTFRWRDVPGDTRNFTMFMGGPRLGVETQDLNTDLGGYFQVPDGRGVLVTRVLEDTPASRAGLKAGDVILEVGGTRVDDSEALRRELRELEAGPAQILVLRRGARQTLTARIEEREGRGMAMRVPRAPRMRSDVGRMPELRREMEELEREMDELRRELNELRRESDR